MYISLILYKDTGSDSTSISFTTDSEIVYVGNRDPFLCFP